MSSRIQSTLTTALLAMLPSFAQAQALPDPLIHLTSAQAGSFAPAFTALASQAHRTVVAEDQPFYPTLTAASQSLSPARRAAALLTWNKDGEPLSTLLPKLAAAYDYDVQTSGKAFLLKKRYTDAADLPSITIKECALGLEEVSKYTGNFDPHFPDLITNSPVIKDLVYSLTPEQLDAMKDNKRGVPVASLTLTQQQEVWQFALHLNLERPLNDLPSIVSLLNRTPTDPRFGWRYFPKMSARMFGYDSPVAYQGFRTLSKPNQVKVFGTGSMEFQAIPVDGEPPPLNAMQPTSFPDPTDPLPVLLTAPRPAPPVSSSLAEALARLNARAADGLKASVESYLAPKRVTVFGEESATPKQELDALADVYGLRVLTEEKEGGKDRLRLTRRTAQVPLDVVAPHDSVLQALPNPLVRACRLHLSEAGFDPASPIPPGLSPLLVYAIRQIRTAAEPKVKLVRDGRVALSALSEQEGRALATLLTLDAMATLGPWTGDDAPGEFTRFNDLRLTGGLYEKDGKKQMSLMIQLPDPNDPNTLSMIGDSELNYDPVNHTL